MNRSPDYVKGAAEAIGIELVPVGRALVMSEADYRRVVKSVSRSVGVRPSAN